MVKTFKNTMWAILVIGLIASVFAGTYSENGQGATFDGINLFQVNGVIPMTGNLNMSNNIITNLFQINSITATELNYLSGVTSNIQTQLDNMCPVGYSCPTTYTELVSDAANSSIKKIWLNEDNTYAESGDVDLDFTDNDKVVKGNGATISFDTTSCSGGSVQLDTDNNYRFYDFTIDFNGCSTDGIRAQSPTDGEGSLELYEVTLKDIDDQQKALIWWGKNAYVWKSKFENVCSGFMADYTGSEAYVTIEQSEFTGNRTACGSYTEGEGIEINHANISAKILYNTFGSDEDPTLAFDENFIDCNGYKCLVQGNTLYNDPANTQANTMIFTDINYEVETEYKVSDNTLYDVCDEMTGIEVGATGDPATVYKSAIISNNVVLGCGDGSDGDNTGIKLDADLTKAIILGNIVEDVWRGVRTAGANITIASNEISGFTDKAWQDDAASALRATNLRYDANTMQVGTSGYVCVSAPVREWELVGGQVSC